MAAKSATIYKICGYVAQWIEHQIPVLRVGGSNPSILVLIKALKLDEFTLIQGFQVGTVKRLSIKTINRLSIFRAIIGIKHEIFSQAITSTTQEIVEIYLFLSFRYLNIFRNSL